MVRLLVLSEESSHSFLEVLPYRLLEEEEHLLPCRQEALDSNAMVHR